MNWIRTISFVLVAGLTASLIACTGGGKSSTDTGSTGPLTPAPSGEGAAQKAPDNSKKLTISLIDGTWASPVPDPNGEGVALINKKFNIELKAQYTTYDEYANKLPVVMAAGDLPDMIGMENADANFVKWAKQGAFLPLNEYIDKYETLKIVPKHVWDAVTVDGKIYAIPQYFPDKYGKKPIIRKDWLDALNLKMPTNYEELVKVAIAFATQDPDKNGKNDTYGLAMAKSLVYGAWMGVQWDTAWYHKNEQGQLIPGFLSNYYKQHIQALADMYKGGALKKDWAVTRTQDARNDFFSGKAGIFYEQPYDISETRFKTLKSTHPSAELAVIPPFKGDDGQQGFAALPGFYQIVALNAKLKNDPDKVSRILQIQDYFRKFIPVDQRNPRNPDFDWINGLEGKSYQMVDGVPVSIDGTSDKKPVTYITSRGWAPSNEANEPAKAVKDPFTKSFVEGAVNLLKNTKFYLDPVNRIHSEVLNAKGSELYNTVIVENLTKMIVGNMPISDWDKMVQEYLNKGGKEIIDDVNAQLKKSGITGEWK